MTASVFAPAKLNLFLHVGPPQPDGYHPLCSLVVFADVGDTVAIEPAEAFELRIDGPFAPGLSAGPDNLVTRAARAVTRAAGFAPPPARLLLTKSLPLAAGVGGGSADAGATFKLLREALELDLADAELDALALELGADGPMCLWNRPSLAEGRGEQLSPAPALPELHAVLVNPGVPSPTGAVYAAYDRAGAPGGADRPALPEGFESVEELAAVLAGARNDLEAPAVSLTPAIGETLAWLRETPETLFARMSGSGATCFALCGGELEAESLAERIGRERPRWWARACRLGGPWG